MLHTICVRNSINQGLEFTLYLFTIALVKSVGCIKQIEILFSFESILNVLIPSAVASFPFWCKMHFIGDQHRAAFWVFPLFDAMCVWSSMSSRAHFVSLITDSKESDYHSAHSISIKRWCRLWVMMTATKLLMMMINGHHHCRVCPFSLCFMVKSWHKVRERQYVFLLWML